MAKLVSKTYSNALFEVALEMDAIDKILAEYTFVVESMNQHPDFYEILTSPKVTTDEKKKIIDTTYQAHISGELINFFKLLIDKKRIDVILKVFDDLAETVDEYKGNVVAKVESVIPLEANEIEVLIKKLNDLTGKNVTVNNVINPDIVGGMIVKIGDKIIDGSVQRKLHDLKNDLAQVII
jgi:F-type H+-transporting ATPase subunit delta